MTDAQPSLLTQTFPDPVELRAAVRELHYLPGWTFWLDDEDRGQGCTGLTLNIMPSNPDSYTGKPLNTRFLYPVPAAAFNRESWEEWIWARIEETEGHERSEAFKFLQEDGSYRRPFKPAHADGWNPGVVRTVVSDTVTNTPNAGRLVKVPCSGCRHDHSGRMGEHFVIARVFACGEPDCSCDAWGSLSPS